MFLRSLFAHLLRQKVRDKLHEAAAEAVKQTAAADDEPPPPDTTLPPQSCEVGFVFALGIEAGGLVDQTADRVTTRGAKLVEHLGKIAGRPAAIVETGVGRQAAELGCRDLIAVRRPKWIVSAGLAGGLSADLPPGHLLVADCVCDTAGNSILVDIPIDAETIAAQSTLHVGRLLTVDRVIAKPEEKQRLGEQYSALACDMETLAVAQVCREAAVQFVSVRIVCDGVDEEVPPAVENVVRQKSFAGKLGAVTGAIFRDPKNVKRLWKMKTDAVKYAERLAEFSVDLLPRLV